MIGLHGEAWQLSLLSFGCLPNITSRMHDNDPISASKAKANLYLHRRVSRSCAKTLAGSFAALITVTGCVTTGGGAAGNAGASSSLAAVQGARTTQNIVARDQAIQIQNQRRQMAIMEARIARREAAIEAVRQRQIAADKIALQQEQEKAKQAQQQQQQQQQATQGNQGKHLGQTGQQPGQGPDHIPPGQAKKQ
jgi:hypothetical protein